MLGWSTLGDLFLAPARAHTTYELLAMLIPRYVSTSGQGKLDVGTRLSWVLSYLLEAGFVRWDILLPEVQAAKVVLLLLLNTEQLNLGRHEEELDVGRLASELLYYPKRYRRSILDFLCLPSLLDRLLLPDKQGEPLREAKGETTQDFTRGLSSAPSSVFLF